MEPTITCGKHLARSANLAGSRFEDVNLSGAEFENVNLAKATFHDINLSDISITAAQIGGAKFKHIGAPPDAQGRQAPQRPVAFEEMTLQGSTFTRVNLSGVAIRECNMDGMTIDGVPVAELLAAYKAKKS